MASEKAPKGHLDHDEPSCMDKVRANWVAFKLFMWNSEQKAFMGRNARSWAEIGLFYLIYYGCLAAFFGSLIAIFYYGFIDQAEPTYTDKLGTPGMAHRPKYRNEDNIAFNIDNENTYNKFVTDIDELLASYMNLNDSVYENCKSGPSYSDRSRICAFNLEDLGDFCTTSKYGYDIGQPCVYFSLNKVWGWRPQAYANESVPERFLDRWDPNYILFECMGRKDKDKKNIGELEFYPAAGVDFKYYPYVGDTDKNSHYRVHYLTPVVAMRFKNITRDATVRMDCYARARNMEYGEFEGHVEFMVRVNSPVKSPIPDPTAEPTAATYKAPTASAAAKTTAGSQVTAAAAAATQQPTAAQLKTTVTMAAATAGPTARK